MNRLNIPNIDRWMISIVFGLAFSATMLPETVLGCSVCAASIQGESNLFEYYLTTVIMLALPISMVTGGYFIIRHQAKKHAKKSHPDQ